MFRLAMIVETVIKKIRRRKAWFPITPEPGQRARLSPLVSPAWVKDGAVDSAAALGAQYAVVLITVSD
jgi:hypothetical protein